METSGPNAIQQAQNDTISLLLIIAKIREAVGDPKGSLMQDDLIDHCKKLSHEASCNTLRVELLSLFQAHFREPERTLLCDILANKQVLPDPTGERYGFPTTGKEHLTLPNRADLLLKENKALKAQLQETQKEAKKWEELFDSVADPLEDVIERNSYGPTEEYGDAAKRLVQENSTFRKTLKTL